MADSDLDLRIDSDSGHDLSSEDYEIPDRLMISPPSWTSSNLSYDPTVPQTIFSQGADELEDGSSAADLRAFGGPISLKWEPSDDTTDVGTCTLQRSSCNREIDSVMPFDLSVVQDPLSVLLNDVGESHESGLRKSARIRKRTQNVKKQRLRAPKKPVPEEEKDKKYREFREKNNESARKSRQRRAQDALLAKDSWLEIFGSEMDEATKNVMREIRGSFGQQLLRAYEVGFKNGMDAART